MSSAPQELLATSAGSLLEPFEHNRKRNKNYPVFTPDARLPICISSSFDIRLHPGTITPFFRARILLRRPIRVDLPKYRPFLIGMDLKTIAILVISLVAAAPFAWLFLFPFVWRYLGSLLGWYLRRKTEGRRARILEVMNEDIRKYRPKSPDRKDSDDDDWEKLGASAVIGSSKNGGMADKEWDGIVGFFHPFW